ncbi:MAG: glycosyltransferase family 2 protein [Bacteroidales bacterium]|nr:glycosyltransferase family 2 protein [Bacteroidales bacterium]
MIKLSVVIITYNEEKNVGRCLDSVIELADDIVVVDSYSTDKTEEICKNNGARFFKHPFEGYIESKNYANSLAMYPYILSLDADEALSDDLKKSILAAKKSWGFDGYSMNRLANYCGKWIRHGGWYPDKKLRLFDRRKGKWDGLLVHETYQMNEKTKSGFLKGDLLHYTYYSIDEHIKQANHFSTLSAKEYYSQGKKSGYLKIFLNPVVKFLRDYFFRLGFLDGSYGFTIAKINAHTTFLKYSKLRLLCQENKKQIPE